MKKFVLGFVCLFGFAFALKAQNFSNKGKDFWLGYGYHVNMAGNPSGGGTQDMVLYFTSDKNANVTVEIPSNGYKQAYTVIANQITETSALPKTGTQDCRIRDTGYFNTGIHIYSDVDIVAYAHIYNQNVSGASLLFPTNTLGKDYYAISYNQSSNSNNAYSFMFVVAVEDGVTTVKITPSDINKNGKGKSPFYINLNKGQIYCLMGTNTSTTFGSTGTDLTGTRIQSVVDVNNPSASGCKKIAVFCGAGKISIGGTTAANNQTGSGDNLFAQALPASAWGLKYLTAPTGSQPNNYYRICVSDSTTNVYLNGSSTPIPKSYLQRGFFYELKNSQLLTTPGNGIGLPNNGSSTYNLIQADKPINVAQYCTTQGYDGNPSSPGDPEMIYLSPVEQTINQITLNSTSHYAITQHSINIIIRKGGVNSFTLDGINKASSFKSHPQDANYAYAIFTVNAGYHKLYSDTGFNAIAYGFGSAESYGYNAGTNIKDLYTPVFQNQYARINFAATCAGTDFKFSVPLSYQPTNLTWDFGNNPNLTPNNSIPLSPPNSPPTYDSLVTIGGKNLYYYSPGNGSASGMTFRYKAPGVDTIKMYVTNPTPDGCGATNAEYDIPVAIGTVPTANFNVTNTSRCISDTMNFVDASTNLGNTSIIDGIWTFDTGLTFRGKNASVLFPSAKTYNVRFEPISNYGCKGDTIIPFDISSAPIAKFVYSDSCIGKTITFTDSSSIATGTIVKWYWDYGDGTKDTLTTNTSRTKTYNTVGTYNVSLIVESNTGCKGLAFIQPVTIRPLPVTNFALPDAVCLPIGAAKFFDSTTINSGTITKWRWDFGDGGIDSVKNPIHNYAATGSYNVKLTATSNYGCTKDSTQVLMNIYSQPHVAFTITPQVCLRDTTIVLSSQFTQTGPGSGTLAADKFFWNFGDGTTDTVALPKHLFTTKGVDTVRYWVVSNHGCMSDTAVQTTTVNPLPVAGFNVTAANNYCEKRPIKFIDTAVNQSINPATLTRWYWDMGNGTTLSPTGGYNTSFIQYYDTFKVYNVRMMVENSLGCKSDTVTKAINIHGLPQVGFVLPEICLSDALANFTDTSSFRDAASSASTYLWNYNAGSPAISPGPINASLTTKNGIATYKAIGNYKVAFKITSNFGCDSTLTKSFTVNGSTPHADFAILNTSHLCSNDSIRIQDNSTVDFGSTTKNEIYWDFVTTPTVYSADQDPYYTKKYANLYQNFSSPVSKTVTIKLVSHSGNSSVCQNSVTKTFTLNQSPKVQFTTLPGICNDTTARQITQAKETGGVPGTFAYYGTGVNSTGLYTPQNVAAGTYTIKAVYTTALTCADSATKNITVWPSPVAKWGVSSPLCEKNDITFSDSSVANYKNIAARYWDFGDGTNAVYNNTQTTFTKKYTAGNIYNVSLRVMSDSGCRSTYNIQSLNVHYLPVVNFSLPSICLPDGNGTFNDSTTIKDGSQALFSYLWNFGDPNDGTPSTLKNPTHKYTAVGPVNVQLKVTSKDACVDSLTKVLNTIYPQPKANFSATPDTACYGDVIQFTDLSNGISSNAVKWNWDLAGGVTSNIQSPSKKFVDTGNFNISLYIYNLQNCVSDTITKQVVVYPYPKLTMGPDLFVLQGGTITIRPVYIYGNGLSYLWTPSSFLSSYTARNPAATPQDDITYRLTVTGLGGCAVSDTVFIKVLKEPTVPNAFSPNGDGINDTWVIKYLESYPGATVDVYNRYGQSVFHSEGYSVNWDGTFKGQPLPIGTYYYIVDPKNGRKKVQGSVTIIR